MFLFKKLAVLLRGNATLFQIVSAAKIGLMIGFIPESGSAPGLFVFLLALLVTLNANLFLAGIFLLAGKLLSLILMPVSFSVGRFLLDGPLSGLFEFLINAPVLAWFGLEYYVVTGGMFIAGLLGGVVGFLIWRALNDFRKMMAKAEEGSELWHKISSNKFALFAGWLFLGGLKGKKSYAELSQVGLVGNPIRPLGAVLVALLLVVGVMTWFFTGNLILREGIRDGLERANGATVDLSNATLDRAEGRLTLEGLALADPNALENDLFRAESLVADLSGLDILTKRVVLDRIEVSGALSGAERRVPGRLTQPRPRPPEPEETGEGKPLGDWVKEAEVWRVRLAQARQWYERIRPEPEEESTDPETPAGPTLEERLRQQIAAEGYPSVRADHLISQAPRLLIRELVVNGLDVAQVAGESFNINGLNLSTQPMLVEGQTLLQTKAESGKYEVSLGMESGVPTLDLTARDLDVDELRAQLKAPDNFPLAGGTVTLTTNSRFDPAALDLPVQAAFRNVTINVPGAGPTAVENLTIPVKLAGTLDAPRVVIDSDALQDALLAVGKDQLVKRLGGKASELLGDEAGGLLDALGGQEGDSGEGGGTEEAVGNALKGIFGGDD